MGYFRTSVKRIFLLIPLVKEYYLFKKSLTNNVTLSQYLCFKFRRNKSVYWPVHPNSEVTHPQNIFVDINSNPGTRPGCYIQGNGGIYIGKYVRCASNVGIISANHDFNQHQKHNGSPIIIGDYSWIGQNALILPGVKLGTRTIVGAGSVVTHSFQGGFVVIAGNPAKVIRTLNPNDFEPTVFPTEFYGFVPKNKFSAFAKRYLKQNKQAIAAVKNNCNS